MNTIILKRIIFLGIIAAIYSLSADDTKNWLGRMHEVFGSKPIYEMGRKDNTREVKRPGEIYQHYYQVNITGTASATSRKTIKLLNSSKNLNIDHVTNVHIIEKIISTQDELNNGIIRSQFLVTLFKEELKTFSLNTKLDFVSSQKFFQTVKAFEKKYRPSIRKYCEDSIKFSAEMTKNAPEAVIESKGIVLLPALVGLVGGFAQWAIFDGVKANTDENGNIVLSEETVKAFYPEYDRVIQKMRKLQGAIVNTTWEYGKGYTKLDILSSTADIEDKELLAKMIYRMNPIGARVIFPKGNENKKKWVIDIANIGGMLITTGINFDSITGYVAVLNRAEKKEYDDEKAITGKKYTNVFTLPIYENFDNRVCFNNIFNDKNKLVASFKPHGELIIVTDNETPCYVRSIHMHGKSETQIDRNAGLLENIAFDSANVTISCNYFQTRMVLEAK